MSTSACQIKREDETRFIAALKSLEKAQKAAVANGYPDLAGALSALLLMFITGSDARALKALNRAAAPIREVLADCDQEGE